MGGVVSVGVVFEEGEISEMGTADDDDVDGAMFEPVAVVVCFLPSSLFVLLVLLLDFIGTFYRENYVVLGR